MRKETLPLLGIRFPKASKKEIYKYIENIIESPKKFHYIVTPNPEIILKSVENEDYWRILHHADVITADGIGIQYGLFFWHLKRLPRITGVEVTHFILNKIQDTHKKLVIINREDGLSSKVELKSYFKENYPKLNTTIISINHRQSYKSVISKINKIQPEIIFCTLGAPYQEQMLYEIYANTNFQCVAIANGATLDFMLGKQKRAPLFMQKLGLEWLWRLFSKPKNGTVQVFNRAKRIYNAVIKFPLTVIWWKLRTFFIYRYSCMGVVLNSKNEVLISHFKEFEEWGIPKGGGEEHETITETTVRELHEELGIQARHLKEIAQQKNLYKYQWNKQRKAQRGYKGQKIHVTLFKYSGDPANDIIPDNFETDDYKWVKISELKNHVSPSHQKNISETVKFISKNIK